MLPVRDGVDGDVVAVGSVALGRSSFILRRRHRCRRHRHVCRSVTGGSFLLRRHVVWCNEGTKLLVESVSGKDEHYNSMETRAV